MTIAGEKNAAHPGTSERRYCVVAIAASSGGPAALETLLGAIGADLPLPILIVQHMMPAFTLEFTAWLGNATRLPIGLAQDGQTIKAGHVYIAPENVHLKVVARDRLGLCSEPGSGYHRPSANVLFDSVAACYGDQALAVVMTGMGNDGVEGALRVHESGGTVLVQDEASCVVFGMPSATIAAGAADEVVALQSMAERIRRLSVPRSCADSAKERRTDASGVGSTLRANPDDSAAKRSDKERT